MYAKLIIGCGPFDACSDRGTDPCRTAARRERPHHASIQTYTVSTTCWIVSSSFFSPHVAVATVQSVILYVRRALGNHRRPLCDAHGHGAAM